jgi:hypothetical protein
MDSSNRVNIASREAEFSVDNLLDKYLENNIESLFQRKSISK